MKNLGMNSRQRYVASAVTALLLVLLGVIATNAQTVQQKFEWVIAKKLTVNTDTAITGDLTVGDDATITGDAAVGGALAVTGATTTNTYLVLAPQATYTVTANGAITPTGSYQPLTSAGNVGTSSIAAGTAGTVLRLVNVGSNTITISDTGTLKLSGDIALGQYDSLLLLGDGTNWIQMGTSNN